MVLWLVAVMIAAYGRQWRGCCGGRLTDWVSLGVLAASSDAAVCAPGVGWRIRDYQ